MYSGGQKVFEYTNIPIQPKHWSAGKERKNQDLDGALNLKVTFNNHELERILY